MRGWLDKFIEESLSCTDVRALRASFAAAMEAHGFDCVAYCCLTESFRSIRPEEGFRISTFPEEFIRSSLAVDFFNDDPLVEEARSRGLPFDSREIEERPSLRPEQRRVFESARRAGIRKMIVAPVHPRPGDIAFFGLASTRCDAPLSRASLLEIQAICQQMHIRYNELTGAGDGPKLSRREIQVLELIAQGKSNSAISATLGVSPNTVDTLVRRCFEKLGVSSRVEAALAGIAKGIILP